MKRPLIIIVSGGSGSGKTTFARRLQKKLGDEVCSILEQDSYYIDQSAKFDHDGGKVNFDHPDSLEFTLMAKHLVELKSGHAIDVPIYEFATHTRKKETIHFKAHPVILIDGILVLSQKEIREQSDINIFISCNEKIRFDRRLKRDTTERGRTAQGVRAQFENQVKPMHDEFVEPSKRFADVVVEQDQFDDELEKMYIKIKKLLDE